MKIQKVVLWIIALFMIFFLTGLFVSGCSTVQPKYPLTEKGTLVFDSLDISAGQLIENGITYKSFKDWHDKQHEWNGYKVITSPGGWIDTDSFNRDTRKDLPKSKEWKQTLLEYGKLMALEGIGCSWKALQSTSKWYTPLEEEELNALDEKAVDCINKMLEYLDEKN